MANLTFRKTTSTSGLQATLATGTAVVSLTTGNTSNLSIGQRLNKTSGTGVFGSGATILSIDSSSQFTASINHATAGAITFSADSVANSTTTKNASLTNAEIDGNFKALDDAKIEKTTAATSTALGLVKLNSDTAQTVAANSVTATANRTYGIQVNASGQLVVNVPWVDTDTTYAAANATTLGLVKLNSATTVPDANVQAITTTTNRTYGIQTNVSGQLVVNVPWVDTDTTYAAATSTALGLVKLNSDTAQTVAANAVTATANRTYGIQVNASGQLVVNVPWVDVDTDSLQSISDDGTTNADRYITFVANATGAQNGLSDTNLRWNSNSDTLSATNFNSTSDERFKKDILKIENALDKVKQLTGYTFTMIETQLRSSGLSAQQVKKVLPEVVGGNDDRLTLAYGNMMGLIVEAIKELSSQIEDIQNKLNNK